MWGLDDEIAARRPVDDDAHVDPSPISHSNSSLHCVLEVSEPARTSNASDLTRQRFAAVRGLPCGERLAHDQSSSLPPDRTHASALLDAIILARRDAWFAPDVVWIARMPIGVSATMSITPNR